MSPKVSIVVLNYNTRKLLEELLPKLLETVYDHLEIVVADNASTDGSADFVSNTFPQMKLLRLEKNLGYAGGYNKTLSMLDADYFVLLNSDVEVTPNWIQPLVDLAELDKMIAAVQPKILDYKRRTHFEYAGAAGGYIDYLGYPFCKGRIFDSVEEDAGQYHQPEEIFWASGAAMFVRAAVYKEIGGLDEHFFAHMEEIDLCWRMKSRGHKIYSCPASSVYHIGGGTLSQQSSRKTYLNFRNGLRLLIKNYPSEKLWSVYFCRLCLDGIAGLQFLSKGKFADVLAIFKAHWSVFGTLYTWLGYRKSTLKMTWTQLKKTPGFYNRSIVWQFFGKKRGKFSELQTLMQKPQGQH
jgi:GT2 family glycosyltransferase